MVALYDRLRSDGLSLHSAWRGATSGLTKTTTNSCSCTAAFAIVPVPVLLFVACATLLFGTDHPNGKWADRHKRPFSQSVIARDQEEGPRVSDNDGINGVSEKSKHEHSGDLHMVDVEEVVPSGSMSPGLRIFTTVLIIYDRDRIIRS